MDISARQQPEKRLNSLKNGLKMNQIKVMKWPAQSLDLRQIENLWHQVELSLKYKGPFKNANELYKATDVRWNKITQEKVE